MRYVEARIQEYYREETYRIYVTRSLQLAPQGRYITLSYSDLVNGNIPEEKSGDEIINNLLKNGGIKLGE